MSTSSYVWRSNLRIGSAETSLREWMQYGRHNLSPPRKRGHIRSIHQRCQHDAFNFFTAFNSLIYQLKTCFCLSNTRYFMWNKSFQITVSRSSFLFGPKSTIPSEVICPFIKFLYFAVICFSEKRFCEEHSLKLNLFKINPCKVIKLIDCLPVRTVRADLRYLITFVRPNVLNLTTLLYFSVQRLVGLPGSSLAVWMRIHLCQEYITQRKFDLVRLSWGRIWMTGYIFLFGVENLQNLCLASS